MSELGRRIWIMDLTVLGKDSEGGWVRFLYGIANALDMALAGTPDVRRYPLDGKGGNGLTIFQPITDSFLALDTWPDHGGVHFTIHSCKEFNASVVLTYIYAQGLKVHTTKSHIMELPDGQVRQQDRLRSGQRPVC